MRAMKDSGIEWIGQIPQEWDVQRGKYTFNVLSGFAFPSSDFSTSEGIPLIRIRDITSGITETFFKGTYSEEFLVDDGDLLIGMDGDFGIRVWDNGQALLNQRCCKIIANEGNSLKYLYYVLPYELKQINDLAFFTTVKHLSTEDLALVNVPLPSTDEQKRIAEYLDAKCAEIDALIAAKEKTNTLLKERRQSIIYEAVSKGLNPDAPMKDSGIEWIGQIPEHWDTLRLRFLGTFQNGISKAGEFFGSGYPFVSYGDVYKNEVLLTVPSGLVESSESERELYSVQKGDVFFTRTSETKEEIGIVAVCKETIPNATFAGFLIRMRPTTNAATTDFLRYYFSCGLQREYFAKEMTLVTRASLGQDLLKNMVVTIPPTEEQQEIVNYLDEQTRAIDAIIACNDASIQKLKEYRQSIIYEAVTGKIEV